MKVIFCSPLMSYPGHFRRIALEKSVGMVHAGMDVTIVAFREAFGKEFRDAGLAYESVEATLSTATKRRTESMARRFWKAWFVIVENYWVTRFAIRLARAKKADIVFISDIEPWVVALLVLMRAIRRTDCITGFIPYPYFEWSTARTLPVLSFCRALIDQLITPLLPRWITVICDNEFTAERLFGRQSGKIGIVPEGFIPPDVSKERKSDARAKIGLREKQRALLLFGVDNQNKGAQYLYEALAGLEANFTLMVVGTVARLFGSLDKRRDHGLAGWMDNVLLVPRFVTNEEQEIYFAACDAVALPYRKGFHTASQGLRDAISYGKALVVSDQYVVGNMVAKHRLGLLFPPEDIEGLRNSLREFARKPDEWFDEIARRGKEVAAAYSWDKVGMMYRRVFEQIIQNIRS